ncbi:penicillin-binding transpeptidase domain-containing protein, partial [Patescibacteria group bacterium]|nr:penicillin-binding transpeptidase domain-containing protein [Patescibacteria group bacterium]
MVKTGVAFPDYISTEKIRKRNRNFEGKIYSFRGFFLIVCLVLAVGAILIKLFYLQVIEGAYFRYLADNNRTKTVVVHAARGIIFDRKGVPLVYNVPGFRKVVDGKTTLINKDEAISLIAKGEQNLEVDSLREYPFKEAMAHVVGYIGQISKEELEDPKFSEDRGGDIIGKIGIERQYEDRLKGVDEKQLMEVNSVGKIVRKLGQTDPIPGENIRLTVSADVQSAAYESMKKIKKGAVIVSSPKGEILALYSSPSFDPNLFTLGKTYRTASDSAYPALEDVLLDTNYQPLLNRAISGTYPPGSTFKLIVAAGGLEDKIIDENWEVEDTGVIKIGEFSFANWFYTGYGKTDGSVGVVKGIKRSNDIFFYKLGDKMGANEMAKWSKKFGIGKPLGIDLEEEASGLVPTMEWKKENIGEPWYLGDNFHYGIGQGYLLTTPLQVNAWTQAIANAGILYQPHLLLDQKPRIAEKKFLSQKTVELVRQGMIEACEVGGVAWPLFDYKVKNKNLSIDGRNFLEAPQATTSAGFKDYRKVSIACKTGTAQHGGEQTMPHSWITLFAPAYKPEIVVTVLAEESVKGLN